jgi:zinc D-Ala-D-Ala dipeptidase
MKLQLFTPIPNLDKTRQRKLNYRSHPIDASASLFTEPLVSIKAYGLAGVSYYSRPNNITGDPVPGVSPEIFVRQWVAEKLAAANEALSQADEVTNYFGGTLELYVSDGFRPPELIALIHDELVPKLLRTQHPDWTEEQIVERRKHVVAYPEWSEQSLPSHFTGGAVDIGLKFVGGDRLAVGRGPAELGKDAIFTDYLEQHARGDKKLEKALYARRVLYNLLTSDQVGGVAMANNPTEEWHFSLYDQMWAKLSGKPAAFYGVPKDRKKLK